MITYLLTFDGLWKNKKTLAVTTANVACQFFKYSFVLSILVQMMI